MGTKTNWLNGAAKAAGSAIGKAVGHIKGYAEYLQSKKGEDSSTRPTTGGLAQNDQSGTQPRGAVSGAGYIGGQNTSTSTAGQATGTASGTGYNEHLEATNRESKQEAKEIYSDTLVSAGQVNRQAYESADETWKKSYQNVAKAEKRAIVDARTSYAKNLAGYGVNAETLAGMGLTGSGYSDYLNSRAYATQRDEVQKAGAQATAGRQAADELRSETKRQADTVYQQTRQNAKTVYDQSIRQINRDYEDGLYAAEETRKSHVTALLGKASEGTDYESLVRYAASMGITLTEQEKTAIKAEADLYAGKQTEVETKTRNAYMLQLKNMAYNGADLSQLGEAALDLGIDLTEEEWNTLWDITDGITEESSITEAEDAQIQYAGIVGDYLNQASGGVGYSDILADAKRYGINLTDEDKASIQGKAQEYRYNGYHTAISAGGVVDPAEVDALVASGELSEGQRSKLIAQWNAAIDASEAVFGDDVNGYMTYNDAQKLLQQELGHAWTSAENKVALQNSFNKLYKPVNMGGWITSHYLDAAEMNGSDHFDVSFKGETYQVQVIGGAVTGQMVNEAAETVPDRESGTLFLYDGDAYVKWKKKVYKISATERGRELVSAMTPNSDLQKLANETRTHPRNR